MAKRPRTKSNLLEKLSEEEASELAGKLVERYDQDIADRAEWESKRAKWYRLWLAQPDPERVPPWPGAANVTIPILPAIVNQFASRAYASIFEAPKLISVMPVEANDFGRAKKVEDYMNWQLTHEMVEYEQEFDKLLTKVGIDGTAFKKVYFCANRKRPVIDYVSGLDVILPYKTRNLEESPRIFHRLERTLEELRRSARQGFYDEEQVEKIVASVRIDDDEVDEVEDDAQGMSPSILDDTIPLSVIEAHVEWEMPWDSAPRHYIVWIEHSSRTVLRVSLREYRGEPIHYFVDYHLIPNPEGFYSYGYGHFIEDLNRIQDTLINQFIDQGRITNTPFGFYGRRAGFRDRNIKLFPGKMYEVEDASQVVFPKIPGHDGSLVQALQAIDRYVEVFTANSEPMAGRQQKGVREPTARGTMALIEQGMVSFGVMTKRMYRAQEKELRYLFKLNALHTPEEKQFRVLGSTSKVPFAKIYADDWDGHFDIRATGNPAYASNTQRRQESMALVDIAMRHPLIGMPNQETGEVANPQALMAFTKELVRTFQRPDLDNYIPEIPPPPISPWAENAGVLQYEEPTAKLNEDHQYHVQLHETFLRTMAGRMMKPEQKEMLFKHIQDHQAMVMREQEIAQGGVDQGPQNGNS